MTVLLTVTFGGSERLAGAYGTAVSTTMLLTTALLYNLMRERWQWPLPLALATSGLFLSVDLVFFSANLLKIAQGGWIPLTFGAIVFVLMTTWHAGVAAVNRVQIGVAMKPERFRAWLKRKKIARVPGTAIFLTRMTELVPPQVVQHAEQFGSLAETVVALTLVFEDRPRVLPEERIELEEGFDGFWQMTVRYGFVEIPDLPAALRNAKMHGCPIDLARAVFFSTRDRIVRNRRKRHLRRWQLPLFAILYRNSVRAVDLFDLPPQNFIEVSRQLEL
jgi:KUP system potassium uptake protein